MGEFACRKWAAVGATGRDDGAGGPEELASHPAEYLVEKTARWSNAEVHGSHGLEGSQRGWREIGPTGTIRPKAASGSYQERRQKQSGDDRKPERVSYGLDPGVMPVPSMLGLFDERDGIAAPFIGVRMLGVRRLKPARSSWARMRPRGRTGGQIQRS